ISSDRQYRRALPIDKAMEVVAGQSGISYDPRVVELLHKHYREWESRSRATPIELGRLSTGVRIERGHAPAAGFEAGRSAAASSLQPAVFLSTIAAARQEAQVLFELSQDLVTSLALNEMLSVVSVRLKKLIPFDTFAVYLNRDGLLAPEFVVGDDHRLFSALRIPLGQGLAGWVAENRKPIVNGNPSVEPGYLNDATKFSVLRSALAVPLEGSTRLLGTLVVYSAERDLFTQDHLRILLAACRMRARSFSVWKNRWATAGNTTARWPWRCATWTVSRASTTTSAMWRATACCSRSRSSSGRAAANRITSRGWAATSSGAFFRR
ncbi:MAG: GAF domain-containing protein, partial [Candidatus Solibacter usitatus]|nr:GAF domain-containing protein [Candidatus Solibacter usitatus]